MVSAVETTTSRTWITLCNPADPRNVGGVIRVAANFGFKGVRIVTKTNFDARDLLCFSSEASEKVRVEFYENLNDCLAEQHFVLGTTRRRRDPDAPAMSSLSQIHEALPSTGDISLLFGAERTGLVSSEVERCQHLIWIPTSDVFPSMNLAHAVAVFGYAISQADTADAVPPSSGINLPSEVSQAKQEAFFAQLAQNLGRAKYPPGRRPQGYLRRIRRLLARANPSQEELGLLGGVFSELARLTDLRLEKEKPSEKDSES